MYTHAHTHLPMTLHPWAHEYNVCESKDGSDDMLGGFFFKHPGRSNVLLSCCYTRMNLTLQQVRRLFSRRPMCDSSSSQSVPSRVNLWTIAERSQRGAARAHIRSIRQANV